MNSPPQAIILAGPNGAGKSTASGHVIAPEIPFVNADIIAQEVSGQRGAVADVSAGRIVLDRLALLQNEGQDFALETTLATKILSSRIKDWQALNYEITLFYFWLPSADLAVQRVADRVARGGHDVPEETIRRRYRAGLRNFFNLYMPLVTRWKLYDGSHSTPNSSQAEPMPVR